MKSALTILIIGFAILVHGLVDVKAADTKMKCKYHASTGWGSPMCYIEITKPTGTIPIDMLVKDVEECEEWCAYFAKKYGITEVPAVQWVD
jgi:hypothetical protein